MSILMNVAEAEFTYLKEKTNATAGNLSVQLDKLKKSEYITVAKSFRDNYPLTVCKATDKGKKAFEKYVNDLKTYIRI